MSEKFLFVWELWLGLDGKNEGLGQRDLEEERVIVGKYIILPVDEPDTGSDDRPKERNKLSSLVLLERWVARAYDCLS